MKPLLLKCKFIMLYKFMSMLINIYYVNYILTADVFYYFQGRVNSRYHADCKFIKKATGIRIIFRFSKGTWCMEFFVICRYPLI